MKVLLTGASGMIGNLVLLRCLESPAVTIVVSLVRKLSGNQHPKLVELVIHDFEDYSYHQDVFRDTGALCFCMGVYTGQVNEKEMKKITVDYPVAMAEMLARESPGARFCLLSGGGADRTEKSSTLFARLKGMAENRIAATHLKLISFRPGYIYPVAPRKEPNMAYAIFRKMYPLIKLLGNKFSIKSTDLAEAIFYAACHGADFEVMENRDILNYLHAMQLNKS